MFVVVRHKRFEKAMLFVSEYALPEGFVMYWPRDSSERAYLTLASKQYASTFTMRERPLAVYRQIHCNSLIIYEKQTLRKKQSLSCRNNRFVAALWFRNRNHHRGDYPKQSTRRRPI